ncbi:MAG: hypothetical protein HYR90_03930 [Candidatus Andersenbacteria bacterium]|nr:hypothetical protein [Candidatus Andersenbacteria bacterium]MBI3250408.1 hypothetical protein [Candidatus Andersenbacteria bacterium]
MSFEELREAILKEAQQEAERTAASLKKTTTAEQDRIIQRAKALEETILHNAELEGGRQAQQLRQTVELESRSHVLEGKEEELKKTQQVFLQEILVQDGDDLVAALLTLVPEEDGVITPGEKHATLVKKLARGKKIADETIPNEGGFIFRGKTTELNVTTSHLVERLFKKHRAQIASMLFSS